MKRKLSGYLKKSGVAALVLAGSLALSAPATVMAAERGGHGYSGGGRAFGGGEHFGGGQRFGGQGFRGGEGYRGGGNYYRGGDHDRDRDYYRPGFRYGYGYGYAAPYFGFGYSYSPNTCGYYDAWGRWIPNPACYAPGYGY